MTYREQLNKVKEFGINILDLTIANELDCVLDAGIYTENEFERLCKYAIYIYLKADSLPPEAIAKAIVELLKQGKTVCEITSMDKHVFIDKACWYL